MHALLTPLRRIALMPLSAMVLLLAGGPVEAMGPGIGEFTCGPLSPPGQFGPYDYRTAPSETRHKVEDYHFTQKVEQGIEGQNGTVGGDTDYTLRAFPNNPRALLTMSRYSLKHHTEHVAGARYSTECYFERAMRFQPNDPMVHLIYAIYLKDRKRIPEVREQLDQAEQLRGDQSNFDFDYNVGLLYFDIGAYDKSMDAARQAYALGAPFPALEKKLRSAGKWQADATPKAGAEKPTDKQAEKPAVEQPAEKQE